MTVYEFHFIGRRGADRREGVDGRGALGGVRAGARELYGLADRAGGTSETAADTLTG